MSRKQASIDLQQVVVGELRVNKRSLNSASGSAVKSAFFHEAAVVTTENGDNYLIDIGVGEDDDINFTVVYREGTARIALVKEHQLQTWLEIKSVRVKRSGVTLEDLLNVCNGNYSCVGYNCWNAVERMIKCVDADNNDLSWQGKAVVTTGAAVGAGALLIGGISILASALGGRKVPQEEK